MLLPPSPHCHRPPAEISVSRLRNAARCKSYNALAPSTTVLPRLVAAIQFLGDGNYRFGIYDTFVDVVELYARMAGAFQLAYPCAPERGCQCRNRAQRFRDLGVSLLTYRCDHSSSKSYG